MKKYMLKTSMLSVAVAVALGTVGCSSGGGSGDTATATASAGTAIDGILVGSTVCIDVNNNNICDAGEPADPDGTDSKGKFEIPETTQTGALLLIGGTDSGTGQAFTGMLKAPAGSTVVTPLTSAVQSLVESGKSAEDAEANIKAALGIPATVDLVNFDPFEEIDGANAADAQVVLAKQTQLQVLVHTAAVTVAGADTETNVEDTMSSVFDAIVTNFDGASGEVTLDAAAVATATRTVADEVYADNAAARVATKVVAASTAEDAVRDADSAEDVISSGTAAAAIDNLNNAITLVNTSTEDAVAAAVAAATANADLMTAEALAEIERLQDERDRLEAEIAAAEAAAMQAAADAQAALNAATTQAAYEAALLEQAAAEELGAVQAAAELAAAEAAAAAAQAEADISAALAAAAEAEALAAAAQAAAEQAAAEAAALAMELAAAEVAAAADLAAAQAAAEAAIAIAVAETEMAMYVQIATSFATQAEGDANATRVISAAGYAVSAEVTAAEAAAAAALQAASDANLTTIPADGNISASIAFKDEAETQAGLALAALNGARVIKSAADLAAAAALAEAAKVARIQVIVTTVTGMNSSVSTALATANDVATQVGDDMNAILALLVQYPTAQTVADAAVVTAAEAEALFNEATALAATVATAKTNVDAALIAVDETDAQAAEASALAAQALFTEKVTEAGVKAEAVAAALVDVEAIKTEVDANIAAAIAASQAAAVASSNAAQASALAANVSADAAELITNPNASVYIAAAVEAAAAATTAAGEAEAAAAAAAIATTVVDAGNAANAAATAATAAADAATAAATALTNAQNADEPVTGVDATWYDGKTLHGFWIDKDNNQLEVMYEDIVLNSGTIFSAEYAYDISSDSWILDTSTDDDMTLNTSTGIWEADPTTETYVINTGDNTIMTLNGVEDIRIDSVTDLAGTTVDFESEDGSVVIPVTFSAGALKYNISWKNLVDAYRLEWTPTDWNTGATYASLEDYMNTNGHFYWDEVTRTSVQTQKDPNGAIDNGAFPIGTLTLGESGPLVAIQEDGTTTAAGTWTVINLPGQSGVLTIDTALNAGIPNYDSYMRYGKALATIDSGVVRMVEFETAMTTFVTEDEDAMGNDQAIADIKAAVEAFSFPTTIDVEAYFESGTKYFINENTIMGERTFYDVNSTYTGVVNGSAESGTYSVTNNVMTLIRDADGSSYEFTYLNPAEYGNGETFSLSINGNPAIETYNYSSDADRADGMVAATAFMKDFFLGTQKFYLNENQAIGDRTFSAATGTTVPYTGTYTGNVGGSPVDGSYTVFGDTLRLDRTGGVVLVFEHTGATTDLSVNTFSLSVNGGTAIVTTNYASETARDAAAAALTFSSDLGSMTEADFIAITQTANPIGSTWWYVEDALNMEAITISSGGTTTSDGTVDFNETVAGAQGEVGSVFFTLDSNSSLGGDFVAIQDTDGGIYVEYVKFYDAMNQADLMTAFPNITWSATAAAVKNAGINAVDSFDAWTDDGSGFNTVTHTNFDSLIGAMIQGTSTASSGDEFITGNGIDVLLFESGTSTSATSGNVVTSDGTAAGTFTISDVDSVSTLVVTITHADFMEYDDHIAFQYTDIGSGIAMYRGNIYDRWSDLLLNTDAKNDVVNFLTTP